MKGQWNIREHGLGGCASQRAGTQAPNRAEARNTAHKEGRGVEGREALQRKAKDEVRIKTDDGDKEDRRSKG